jgi:hypothetical protein
MFVLQNNKKPRWNKFWPFGSLYGWKVTTHSKVSKFTKAIANCENVTQINPKSNKAYICLGWVYHVKAISKKW